MDNIICETCHKTCLSKFGSGRFCSRSCANTRTHSEETKKKLSLVYGPKPTFTCTGCGVIFERRRGAKNTSTNKFCSFECVRKSQTKIDRMINGRKGGLISANNQPRRSKNEMLFAQLCAEKYDIQTNQNIFNGWDADIILVKEKVAVLWNGIWHYKQISKSQSLKQVQSRDKIKQAEIQNCGFTCYIIIDMGKFNPDFVHDEFKKFCIWLLNRVQINIIVPDTEQKKCQDCNIAISCQSLKCRKCAGKSRIPISKPSINVLKDDRQRMTLKSMADKYKVTSQTISRWLRS